MYLKFWLLFGIRELFDTIKDPRWINSDPKWINSDPGWIDSDPG
jgi:hypothetical protein